MKRIGAYTIMIVLLLMFHSNEMNAQVETMSYDIENVNSSCNHPARIFWSSCLVSNWADCSTELGRVWAAEEGMSMVEFDDGTATIQGTMTNLSDSELKLVVEVTLSGRTSTPPSGSPKVEDCATGQTGSEWYYYTSLSGTMTGLQKLAGGVISVVRYGPAFQVGEYGSLKSNGLGASSWMDYDIVSQPSSGIHITDGNLVDFNFNLAPNANRCQLSVDVGGDKNICEGESVTLTASLSNESECCPTGIDKIYKIGNSTPDCLEESAAGTSGPGVFFRRPNSSTQFESWTAGNDLRLTKYTNGTGTITGSIHNGNQTAVVNITATDFTSNSDWWICSGVYSGTSSFGYEDFNGTISLNGVTFSINDRSANYDLSAGNFDLETGNPFGLAGWSGGTWGESSEVFGILTEEVCTATNPTFLWSNGATTQSITVSPTSTTTYTVTATDCKDCEANDDIVVTVNEQPTANAGPDKSICEGESATLTASGGGNYLWSTGATTAGITVNPASTTTYTVTVTSNKGCSDSDEAKVTVNEQPIANAGSDKEICEGESTTLTASGGGNYLWSTGATTASITVSPTSTKIYTVTVTSNKGCSDSDETKVTVNDQPVANAGPDKTICSGQSTTLTASGGGDYLWSTGATTASITVNPANTTTYTVTVTNNKGCADTDEAIVSVESGFISGINAPTTKCAEEDVLFQADPAIAGATYEWSFTGPATPTTATSASVLVSWSVQGVYTATLVVKKGGCEQTYTHDVNITQEVFGAAGRDTTICKGASVQIGGSPTGPPGATYVWTPNLFMNNNTVSNPTVTPPVSTEYTVQVSQNGCTRTVSVMVNVDIQLNPVVVAGSDKNICNGESVTIGGAADPTVFFYQWSTSAGDITGANASTLEVSPTATTLYIITGYNQLGCVSVDSVVVEVNSAPPAPESLQEVFACEGKPFPTLVVFVEPGNTANWYDAPVNGNLLAEGTLTYQPNQLGTYYIEQVTNSNNCNSSERFEIEVSYIGNCDDCNTPDCLGIAIQDN